MTNFPMPQDHVVRTFGVPLRALLKARNNGTLQPSDLVSLPPNKIGYTPEAIAKLIDAGVIAEQYRSLLPAGALVQSQRYPQPVPQSRPVELLDPWEQPQRWQSPSGAELSALSQHLSALAGQEERTLARPAGDYRGALFVNGDIHFHVHKRRKAAPPAALPAVTRQQKDFLQLAMIGLCLVTLLAAIVQAFRPIVVNTGGGYERIR